jgi:hypothetical protein
MVDVTDAGVGMAPAQGYTACGYGVPSSATSVSLPRMDRRGALSLIGIGALGLFHSKPAWGSVARALSLSDLVKRSTSVLVLTGLAQRSSWQTVGSSRRIVTETRARVDELVSGADPSSSEVLIRTLGGSVGEIGQLVEGEAELTIGEQGLTFLMAFEPARFAVTGMAQGHYPVVSEKAGKILRANRKLPALVGKGESAIQRLSGLALGDALALVRAERR